MHETLSLIGYLLLTDKIGIAPAVMSTKINHNYKGVCRERVFDSFEEYIKRQHESYNRGDLEIILIDPDPNLYPEGHIREAYKVWREYERQHAPEYDREPYSKLPFKDRIKKYIKDNEARIRADPNFIWRQSEKHAHGLITEFDIVKRIYKFLKDGGANTDFLRCEIDRETGLPNDSIGGRFLGYDIAPRGLNDSSLPFIGQENRYANEYIRYLNKNGLFDNYEVAREFFEKYEVGKEDSVEWNIYRLSEIQI